MQNYKGLMKSIPLTQGKFAIVDDEDYSRLNQYKWATCKNRRTFYAVRAVKKRGKWTNQEMGHDIFHIPKNFAIDHINHNGLDNRKANLRTCTASENRRNSRPMKHSSKYKGVSWHKWRTIKGKWRAYICPNYSFIHLGFFDSEIEAAKKYDQKAKELFGEFAYLNFK